MLSPWPLLLTPEGLRVSDSEIILAFSFGCEPSSVCALAVILSDKSFEIATSIISIASAVSGSLGQGYDSLSVDIF